ncbi:MAG: arylsulfatase [Parvibaculum sp.]|uniref:arylsulfatase n=1 Tax=Parvibaculum sp. TaxID=2024848 RepID=UPI00271874C2|nr:arylsulfatase [Parvibaculum sp.]MDO8838060.1 arylsulfatase [Parvibaculum sp.]
MKLSEIATLAAVALSLAVASPALAQEARPNIVIILADDAGFSDFGAYGSEIATPNIDALAARGTLFSNFHASPICAPSRAMLMTGVDSHLAGIGNLPESAPLEHRGRPGYLGRLADDVVTVASRLSAAGYRTTMTGKWHLGHGEGSHPAARGFDRSFALEASGADNWEKKSYLPIYDDAPWYEDGKPADLPADFYSSAFIVDKTIEYLEESRDEGRPFFSYLAFQAIHIPLQAPRAFVEKYDGVYDAGWDALREARFRAVIERGLLPADMELGPMPGGLRDWAERSEDEKRMLAKSMAVNAAMLEAMDFHVGRLIDHLKESGQYDNTVFIVLSDNGPEPGDPLATPGFRQWLWWSGYNRDIETLGEKGSYVFIGPEFASAAASPGAFFKFQAGEGGLRVPLIFAGRGVARAGTTDAFSYITDIAPTILELAGVAATPEFEGTAVQAMTGRSLAPLLRGAATRVYGETDAVGIEAAGNAALFRGDYKLVRNAKPYGDGQWYLYNLARDPGETQDLSQAEPDLLAVMMAEYDAYAARVGALDVPAGYNQIAQLTTNSVHDQVRANWPGLTVLALLLLGAAFWGCHRASPRAWRALHG